MLHRCCLTALLICGSLTLASAATISLGQPGTLPAGFQFWHGNKADSAPWSVVRDSAADHGVALEYSATDKRGDAFIAFDPSARAADLKARVQFRLIRGRLPSGGLVLRMTSPDDYDLIKVSAYEERLSVIHVINGQPNEIAGVDAEIAKDDWQTLEVDMRGSEFRISLDGRWVLTAFDRSAVREGHVGVWSENDNVTRFGGLQVTAHDDGQHADSGADQTRGERR
ncbi:hypothetical protein [Bradyrhizobium sp. SYSU BS000235]|uniref:hypothetical protein n=1 Tax=Bradyrhizobium sp. SYSU BS000235 TaxID=3411332 RepID=UPI003C75F32B